MWFFGFLLAVRIEGIGLVCSQGIARHDEIHVFRVGREGELQRAFLTREDVAVCSFGISVYCHKAIGIAILFVGSSKFHLCHLFTLRVKLDNIRTKHPQGLLVDKLASILLVHVMLAGEVESKEA